MSTISRHRDFPNILLVTGEDVYKVGAEDYRFGLQSAIYAAADGCSSPVRKGTHDFWITYSLPTSLEGVHSYENLDTKPRIQRGVVRVGALPDVADVVQLRNHLSVMLQEVGHHWLVPSDLTGVSREHDTVTAIYSDVASLAPLLGREDIHWSAYFQADASPLDGQYFESKGTEDGVAVWQNSGNFPELPIEVAGMPTISMGGPFGTYNDLDLLLMGVLTPEEAYASNANRFSWIEPKLTAPLNYHGGIIVAFSPTDLVYFGFYRDHRQLVVQRTGQPPSVPISLGGEYHPVAATSNGVALRVVRRGEKYYFQARFGALATGPGADMFDELDKLPDPIAAGAFEHFRTIATISEAKAPQALGASMKNWSKELAEIEIESLHLLYTTPPPSGPDLPLPKPVRKILKTDSVPPLISSSGSFTAIPFGSLVRHVPAADARIRTVSGRLRIFVPFIAMSDAKVPSIDNAPKVLTKAPAGDFAFGTVARMSRSMFMPRAGGDSIGKTVWGKVGSRATSEVSTLEKVVRKMRTDPPAGGTYKVGFILVAEDRASISVEKIKQADSVRQYWDATFQKATRGRRHSDSVLEPPYSGWKEVPDGGKTLSGPAAVVNHFGETEHLNLFVRAMDDTVYGKVLSKGSWGAWYQVPAAFKTQSRPAAAVFETSFGEVTYLAARSTDGRIFVNTNWKGGGWAGWEEVPGGGQTASAPAVAIKDVLGIPTLRLFVRALDNTIMQNTLLRDPSRVVSNRWGGWKAVPPFDGATLDTPVAVGDGDWCTVFVRGMSGNRIFKNTVSGSDEHWSGWQELAGGGQTPSGPGATCLDHQMIAVVRANDDSVAVHTGAGWSAVPGDGRTHSEPGAVVFGSQLHLFVRALDNHIYLNRWCPAI